MKRFAYIVSAAMVVNGFGIMSSFAAGPDSNVGDSMRNAVDHAGAGTPTPDNPAPDANNIRKAIAELTAEALTKGDLKHLVNRFVDSDSNRLKVSPTYDDNYGKEIDGRIEQISQAWKAKYGHDFDIKAAGNDILSQYTTIQQGTIGNSADAQVIADVMKNSENRNTTDQKNNDGNTKNDENLEDGRSIAVVTVKSNLPDLKVPFIHELPDSWKINVPDSMDANKLRQNLQDQLTTIGQMSTEWPSDENEAYRAVAHHVLMAVLDVPSPAK